MDILFGLYQLKRILPDEDKSLFEECEIQMLDNLHRERLSLDPEEIRLEREKLLNDLDILLAYRDRTEKFYDLCNTSQHSDRLPGSFSSPVQPFPPSDEFASISSRTRSGKPLISVSFLMPILPTKHCYYKFKDLPPIISINIDNNYPGCTNSFLHVHIWIEGYSDTDIKSTFVAARERKSVPFVPLWKDDKVAIIATTAKASLHVKIFVDDKLYDEYTGPIELHAPNTALLAVKGPDNKPIILVDCLAAWITPYARDIAESIKLATRYHNEQAFIGYPDGPPSPKNMLRVRKQAQAIFEMLRHGKELKYVDSSNNFGTQNEQIMQRVPLPSEVLANGSANCLSGTLLFASLLEHISLNPVILLIREHALVGWHISSNAEEKEYEFLDTALIPTDDFTTAWQSGQKQYQEAKVQNLFAKPVFDMSGFAHLIDIESCRAGGITS